MKLKKYNNKVIEKTQFHSKRRKETIFATKYK